MHWLRSLPRRTLLALVALILLFEEWGWEPLAALFGTVLGEVEVRAIDVPTVFRDFDDLWTPFLGGQAPAPGYVATLDKVRREALRERLRATLPWGRIALRARAWAVRGRVAS